MTYQIVAPPPGFCVSYSWCSERGQIERRLPDGTAYLGAGWFSDGERGWHIPAVTLADDDWLQRTEISGPSIVEFLQEVLPRWTLQRLPFGCSLRLNKEAVFRLTVRYVGVEHVDLDIVWRIPAERIQEVPALPGFVFGEGAIWPGIAPQALAGGLPAHSTSLRLSGQDIPRFLCDVWPRVQPWATGDLHGLQAQHRLFVSPARLELVICPDKRRGFGGRSDKIMLVSEGIETDAAALSRQLDGRTAFLRVEGGWVPADIVRKAGIGPMARLADGTLLTKLTSLSFSLDELLDHDDSRVDNPWVDVRFPDLTLPGHSTPQEIARQHLEWLSTWGVPGGVIGNVDEYGQAFGDWLASLSTDQDDFRVLVVGFGKTLDRFARALAPIQIARYAGNRHDPDAQVIPAGITLAMPKALHSVPILSQTRWQLLCLLDADALIKTPYSRLYFDLRMCRRALTVGLFGGMDFLERTAAYHAIAWTFGWDSAVIWRYGLRDPHARPLDLPDALPLPSQPALNALLQPAEIVVDADAPSTGAVPIPPRESMAGARAIDQPLRPSVSVSVADMAGAPVRTDVSEFLAQARRLVNHTERRASFVPFQRYWWPKYVDMTQQQRRWYFYWRGQVREGKAPDTDLFYILIHIYELINNIGGTGCDDCYRQMHRLWLSYRERFPRLDDYLVDWLSDYAIANRCEADPLAPYAQALAMGVPLAHPDLGLLAYLDQPLERWPLTLIEAWSDYQFRRSKFYADGHRDEIERQIPLCLAQVDEYMQARYGGGLVSIFSPSKTVTIQRQLFQNAHYGGARRMVTIQNVVPYSSHAPLREFLTGVIKHSENRLRERAKYPGRLHGFTLEPDIRGAIDALIIGTPMPAVAPVSQVRTSVPIDRALVDKAYAESLEVLAMLQAHTAGVEAKETKAVPALPPAPLGGSAPKSAPAVPDAQLGPLHGILARLDDDERKLLLALEEGGWALSGSALSGHLPGLFVQVAADRINQLALSELGDILLASDADQLMVAADYRDELESLLSGNGSSRAAAPIERNAEEMPTEWADLAGRLADHQLAVLEAILNQPDPRGAIREIADANTTMADVLVDTINDLAIQTVGDIIINMAGELPAIEDESLDSVKRLITNHI